MSHRSKQPQQQLAVSRFVNSGLLVCLLIYATVATLLLFRNFFESIKQPCDGAASAVAQHDLQVPYLPANESDFLALLMPSVTVSCAHIKQVSTRTINKKPHTAVGHEGVHICADSLPASPTPSNCRIYSIDPNPENVFLELKMGGKGCRVHIITKGVELNYGRVSNNTYLYPLNISVVPGVSHYTLDNYINLMSHENKLIHIVKTSNNESEWRLLTALYTSQTKAWRNIKQLRMVVHVPPLTASTWADFSYKYLLVRGLRSIGFHLVYAQPLLLQGEQLPAERVLANRYEMIWLNDMTGE